MSKIKSFTVIKQLSLGKRAIIIRMHTINQGRPTRLSLSLVELWLSRNKRKITTIQSLSALTLFAWVHISMLDRSFERFLNY